MAGCTVQSWRPADLQLEIRGADLIDTDRVRICVEGHGMREVALGAGSIAFTGLPMDTPLEVTVDAVEAVESDTGSADKDLRTGRAGPLNLSPDTPWLETDWEGCTPDEATKVLCNPCQSPGAPVASGQNSWVLAVRFGD